MITLRKKITINEDEIQETKYTDDSLSAKLEIFYINGDYDVLLGHPAYVYPVWEVIETKIKEARE